MNVTESGEFSDNPFQCRRCGACCRIKGIVRLNDKNIQEISAALGMSQADFIANETVLSPDRKCLVLKDRSDGACAMLDESNRCRIYPVRPEKCRTFPYEWVNQDSDKYCQGLAELTYHRVILCLGSNIEPRLAWLDRAETALRNFPFTRFIASGGTDETDPVDVPGQFADLKFLNRILVLETALAPRDFSSRMHRLEDTLGRVRSNIRNVPRTIDIDMIDYDEEVSDDPELTLPHPRAAERAFVTEPLRRLGIVPDWLRTASSPTI
jgi:2-amino-4-hydroxy-6-hydroxymethyldihydropteridine diphosphokinase